MFTGDLNPVRKDRTRNVHVYVPGYEATYKSDVEKLVFMMAPREGSKSEQFKAITGSGNPRRCSAFDSKIIAPYLRALHKELAALATTKAEKDAAEYLQFDTDQLEYGEEVAQKNVTNRREAQRKETK